jgi:short subunit dehydrogenase-like uncharacterized protein
MPTTFPPHRDATHAHDVTIAQPRSNWILYGAYGATGRRILDEALSRGHRPILSGRDSAQLAALGKATGLTTIPMSLDYGPSLRATLSRVAVVLHSAGPFRQTGPLMRAACVEAGCSYLDINGEIGDFAAALACDAQARAAGIGIIPGVGYGVVLAECLAAHLAHRLPDASWLRLSLATQIEARSRGATLSVASALAGGGRDIFRGQLRQQPLAFSNWRAPGVDAPRINFTSAPLGELLAVQRSTRIQNITTGIPLPRAAAVAFRVVGPVIGKILAWRARRPSNAVTLRPAASIRSRIWAEAGTTAGTRVAALLETDEGYQVAAAAAVRALELQLQAPRVGALTPVEAFGRGFASLVPNTVIRDLDPL